MAKQLPNWKSPNHEAMRDFAKVRVFATDVDGTLENSSESVYQNICKQLYSMRRGPSSIKFMIATGRTLAGVARVSSALQIESGTPAIVYNGSLVLDSTSWATHQHKMIPRDFLEHLLEHVDLARFTVFAYHYLDTHKGFSLNQDLPNEQVFGWSNVRRMDTEFNGMPILWSDGTPCRESGDPTAILIQSHGTSFEPKTVELIESDSRVTLTKSGNSYLEIRPAASNKGLALAFASEKLGFARAETLALGDNDNDVEMLRWAGIGIAVAQASPMAIEAADYVCNHGVAEGVIEVLRLISHSRRFYLRTGNPT